MSQTVRRRLLALGIVGCFAAAMIGGSTTAFALDPATTGAFEYADGNTTVDAPGRTDWSAPGGARMLADLTDSPTGAKDESFVKGTKSDTPSPTIETGSIPENRSDLTRMRIATETVNDHVLLFLAWDRAHALPAVNVNLELNASAVSSGNDATPTRSNGDLLITFDSSTAGVQLGLARWSQPPCASGSASASGCWAQAVDLDAGGLGEGGVSADGLFGEAVIDLTAAGVFVDGGCQTFASAHLASRSSSSLSAGLKDFTPSAGISLGSCGAFTIAVTARHDDPATRPDLQSTFEVRDPMGATLVATATTDSKTGQVCVSNVPPGVYKVIETAVLDGYRLDATAREVSVTRDSTCATTAVTFANVPLAQISLQFQPLVPGGTVAKISCADANGDLVAAPPDATEGPDDTSEAFTGLAPGVYYCTIDVGR